MRSEQGLAYISGRKRRVESEQVNSVRKARQAKGVWFAVTPLNDKSVLVCLQPPACMKIGSRSRPKADSSDGATVLRMTPRGRFQLIRRLVLWSKIRPRPHNQPVECIRRYMPAPVVHRYPSTINWRGRANFTLHSPARKEGLMERDNSGCILGCVVAMTLWGMGGLCLLIVLGHLIAPR